MPDDFDWSANSFPVAKILVRLAGHEVSQKALTNLEESFSSIWPTVRCIIANAFSNHSEHWYGPNSSSMAEGRDYAGSYWPRPKLEDIFTDEGRTLFDICVRLLLNDNKKSKIDPRLSNAILLFHQALNQDHAAIGLALNVAAAEALLCDGTTEPSEQLATRSATLLQSDRL